MATRMDIELTSRRDDATFTWRAAGAREPKGVADVSLFPSDAEVGAEFKVEADVELDGITVLSVVPPKSSKSDPFETLELLARDDEPLVTQQLARKERGKGRGKGRDKGKGKGRRDDRGPKGGGRDRRPAKPKLPPKPKPPRLKAGRAHRKALLDGLPEEQKPVAEELLNGGLQAVRTALAKQNEQAVAEGKPQIDEGPMLTLAEKLLTQIRDADWRDRAEAALEQADVVDVRDLRSVVTAAEKAARDDESRSLANDLRTALNQRLDKEYHAWVAEIGELLDDERVVRALHRSSRPPKAGAPLPPELALRLVEATNAALNAETSPDRWGYTLEALAHSPIRAQVVPASLPTTVPADLHATIARFGTRLPHLAEIFGIKPDPNAGKKPRRRKRSGEDKGKDKTKDEGKGKGKDEGKGKAAAKGEAESQDETEAAGKASVDDKTKADDAPAADDMPATDGGDRIEAPSEPTAPDASDTDTGIGTDTGEISESTSEDAAGTHDTQDEDRAGSTGDTSA